MGWEADRVLEGIFQFGAPLNIWKIELYNESNGDIGYFRVHMLLDDDADLVASLRMKMSSSSNEFQRLIVMESPATRSVKTEYWREHYFYNAWLYSIQTDYKPSHYPFGSWKGWTLGIAFQKSAANRSAVANLFGAYSSM
jgi:hypothetical protein